MRRYFANLVRISGSLRTSPKERAPNLSIHKQAHRASLAGARALAALAAGALTLASGATARAETTPPNLCEMVEAFDQALQLRFYRANLAPESFDCRFYRSEGCPYSLRGPFRIKVTHIAPIGCEGDGDCAFMARQVCETDRPSMSCVYIMPSGQSTYRVSGRFREGARGAWTLTDWVREPGDAPGAEVQKGGTIAQLCPELLAQLEQ